MSDEYPPEWRRLGRRIDKFMLVAWVATFSLLLGLMLGLAAAFSTEWRRTGEPPWSLLSLAAGCSILAWIAGGWCRRIMGRLL